LIYFFKITSLILLYKLYLYYYIEQIFFLQDAIEEPFGSTVVDDIPIVDEIPGSITLWEVTPRPSNSSDVSRNDTLNT